MTEADRRAVYGRIFGGGFDEPWVALLAALADGDPNAARHAGAVRSLLSARVDEDALALAPRLVAQLREALDVLDDREILDAHGARDMWELISSRARLDLGVEPAVARVRTMAAAGAEVIAWLAASEDAEVTDEGADAAASWLAAATDSA